MSDKTDRTSAVETLRDAMMTSCAGFDYLAMGAEEYLALLDRVIDAPTDAEGNVLHVGDEVMDAIEGTAEIAYLLIGSTGWKAGTTSGEYRFCSHCQRAVHGVVPDPRERIDADAERWSRAASDIVRRCFALADGEGE